MRGYRGHITDIAGTLRQIDSVTCFRVEHKWLIISKIAISGWGKNTHPDILNTLIDNTLDFTQIYRILLCLTKCRADSINSKASHINEECRIR